MSDCAALEKTTVPGTPVVVKLPWPMCLAVSEDDKKTESGKQVSSEHPGTHHRRMQLQGLAQDMDDVTAAKNGGNK